MQPRLNIFDCHEEVFPHVVSLPTIVGFSQFGSSSHDDLVLIVEEICSLVVFRDEIETTEGNYDSNDAFENVEPAADQSTPSSIR